MIISHDNRPKGTTSCQYKRSQQQRQQQQQQRQYACMLFQPFPRLETVFPTFQRRAAWLVDRTTAASLYFLRFYMSDAEIFKGYRTPHDCTLSVDSCV